jgi:hypothetical protein
MTTELQASELQLQQFDRGHRRKQREAEDQILKAERDQRGERVADIRKRRGQLSLIMATTIDKDEEGNRADVMAMEKRRALRQRRDLLALREVLLDEQEVRTQDEDFRKYQDKYNKHHKMLELSRLERKEVREKLREISLNLKSNDLKISEIQLDHKNLKNRWKYRNAERDQQSEKRALLFEQEKNERDVRARDEAIQKYQEIDTINGDMLASTELKRDAARAKLREMTRNLPSNYLDISNIEDVDVELNLLEKRIHASRRTGGGRRHTNGAPLPPRAVASLLLAALAAAAAALL